MLSSLLIVIAAVAQEPDGFSQAAIARAQASLSPAVCVVTYSAEITNPATGDTSKRDSSALGLIVSPSGLAMAPGHMSLENAEPFNIKVSVGQGDDEKKYNAVLLQKPEDVNICFLKLEANEGETLNLPCVRFTPGARLDIGQPILLVGLLSEALDFARGIFTCRIGAVLEKPRATYCVDSPLRFGFVGGPVVDTQGRVLGVVGFDLTPAEGGDLYVHSGHPLVYQTDLFQKYIDKPPSESVASGRGEEAWLGVFTQPLTDDFAEYWGLPQQGGIIVSSLVPGGSAEAAGLQPGDVIVNFNGVPMHAKQDREVMGFTKLVREAGIGKTVPMKVLRDGKPIELQATLVERPKSARDAGEYKDEVFGVTVREITTDVRILLNLGEDVKGVIVRRVKSGGVADLAGMRAGVIIMDLANHPIATIDDFKEAVQKLSETKPRQITAFCRAGSATGFFRLEPRWDSAAK